MKHYTVSFLIFWLFTSISLATPQATSPARTAELSVSQQPKWTEADKRKLLAKAQQGDRDSQTWLGAACEQGWFGKSNYHEALKWFRKAAAQGDPDAQNALGKCMRTVRASDKITRRLPNGIEWQRSTSQILVVPDREETIWDCSISMATEFPRTLCKRTCGSA
jgi:hypothetical protein